MTSTVHTQAISSADRVVALRRRKLRLRVERGPDKKLRRESAADRVVIGSHPKCDLPLSDPTVSRQHCEIALEPAGYVVRDLGSTNGTRIDKLQVREAVIDGAVKLRVGDTVIAVDPTDQTVDLELSTEPRFGSLLGRSPAMREVFARLAKVAASDATVLITGESGTGKELAARSIHEASDRAAGPFVVVDCGAITSSLIESELFGHRKGAFTGAVGDRVGAFAAADSGTVFLDEIGELPIDMQTRLLGALERREVTPVGATASVSFDAWVVAATNRDLRREINAGAFREDLFFRLAVVEVRMPPLRDRPEDVALYIESFVAETPGLEIDADTVESLSGRQWPGNVRELRNVLERAAALGEIEVDPERPGSLPEIGGEVDIEVPFKVGKAALIEAFERAYLERLLAANDDNISQAARAAKIDRVHILRLLDKYGLRPGRS
jgi:DNA-binding NtrC family response regulator